MAGSGNTTVDSPTSEVSVAPPRVRVLPAVVTVWCKPAPFRVGDVGFIDLETRRERVMGRDVSPAEGPSEYVKHFRQQPGRLVPTGTLPGTDLSRRQLVFRPTPGGVELEAAGKLPVLLNGHPVERGGVRLLRLGDVIQLKDHSNFLFTERVAEMPELFGVPIHAFGQPDAHGFVGESPAAWKLRADLHAAARLLSHVLLLGETGTGKELAARALHRLFGRTTELMAYNAATLPPGVADSMLFGGRKNYPNGNSPEIIGWVEACLGSTFFLDEIGELPLELQGKLLRLTMGEYQRVGEDKPRRANVTLIAATNRPLDRLKADLPPRFDAIVRLPSLAVRKEDVPLLVVDIAVQQALRTEEVVAPFLKRDATGRPFVDMTQAFNLALVRSSYAGNVRDLRRVLLDAMSSQREAPLQQPASLDGWRVPASLPPPPKEPDAVEAEVDALLEGVGMPDRDRLEQLLIRNRWNKAAVGRVLGATRFKVARWMERYGLKKPGEDSSGDDDA